MFMVKKIKSVKSLYVEVGPLNGMIKGTSKGLEELDRKINKYIQKKGKPFSVVISAYTTSIYNCTFTTIIATLSF